MEDQDYSVRIVKQLIKDRRLAPFYRGLDDEDDQPVLECPICFLYYPSNINYTRCCEQPICSECFVQVKRSLENLDPCSCPYCVESDFGVVYTPPSPHVSTSTSPKRNSETSGSRRVNKNAAASFDTDGKGRAIITSDSIRPLFIARQQEMAISRAAEESQRSRLAQSLATDGASGFGSQLEGAATAAANLVENLHSGRFVCTISGLIFVYRSLFRNSLTRRSRWSQAMPSTSGNRQLSNMRLLGADLEEIMLMEAMRRSLVDEQESQRSQANVEESSLAIESQEQETPSSSERLPAEEVHVVPDDMHVENIGNALESLQIDPMFVADETVALDENGLTSVVPDVTVPVANE
ncbi:MAG: hypothetical protein SGCHY_001971 [Lobulomycetales sp.]